MAKIERQTQKIFGNNAPNDDLAVFGSFKAGNPIYTDNIEDLQSDAYEQGWSAALAANEAPFMEEMNGVQYGFSKQLAYLFQQGIPEWEINTTYYLNSFVQVEGVIFKSLQDNNIGNEPQQGSEYWEVWSAGNSGGGLEVCDIGLSLYVDETKGLRRYLNGQIIAITEHTQAFLNRLKQIIALYPALSTTEENWQAAKTLSHLGQVGKFVIDEEAATIRLPRVVNIQGLFDLQNLGLTVAAGLPNITFKGSLAGAVVYNPQNMVVSENTYGAGNHTNDTKGSTFSFDASSYNSIFGNSNTVQEEAIQYPFYIQIATGQETEVNIVNDIELNNPYTLFDSKYSDSELFNTSWLISNNTYHSGTTYITAYEALQVEYNTQVEAGTKVTLPSGTDYTKRGLSVKLSTESYTDYDFVLNTTDSTFRFPTKTKFSDNSVTGLLLYYYVGETVQNANLINAGRLGEQIANVIPNNSELIASYCMPSQRFIDLTPPVKGVKGSYTAPANGYYTMVVGGGTLNTAALANKTTNIISNCSSQSGQFGGFVPAKKGDIVEVIWLDAAEVRQFKFIYAEGAE